MQRVMFRSSEVLRGARACGAITGAALMSALSLGCAEPVLDGVDGGVTDGAMALDAPVSDDATARDAGPDVERPDASLPAPPDWMSASVVSTCASREGRVLCWGRLWDRTALVPTEIIELRGAASVQLSAGATCARLVDGHVACAGDPRSGILGTFDIERSDGLTPIGGVEDAIDLASGTSFACVLRSDASVWCWGDDSVGQTGQPIPDHRAGAYAPQLEPLPVAGLDDVVAIEAGSSFACALRTSGEVACWGSDAWGALGRGAGYSGVRSPRSRRSRASTMRSRSRRRATAVA